MFRERFSKVRSELWEVAGNLNVLADAKPPSDLQLLAWSIRHVCYIAIRVIDALP